MKWLLVTVKTLFGLCLQVAGAKALRDYALAEEVATGGLNGLWKIFSARSRKEGDVKAQVWGHSCN